MLNIAAFVAGLCGVFVLVAGVPGTAPQQLGFAAAMALVTWVVWRVRAMDREAAIMRRLLADAAHMPVRLAAHSAGIGRLVLRMLGGKYHGHPALVHLRASGFDRIGRAAMARDAAWAGTLVPTREDEDGFEAHVMAEGDEQFFKARHTVSNPPSARAENKPPRRGARRDRPKRGERG